MPRVRAPELPQNSLWFNTDKPLSIKQLKGRVIILDFWTYCCINCLHVLPDLKYLEQKYTRAIENNQKLENLDLGLEQELKRRRELRKQWNEALG